MLDRVSIRLATMDDCIALARLAEQLGYPASPDSLASRLDRAIANADHHVAVAQSDGEVVGWIHIIRDTSLLHDGHAEIAGLIVDPGSRNRGIGRRLMESAEHWAGAHACEVITVRSNTIRTDAHRFYESLGYSSTKTQHVFRKKLPAAGVHSIATSPDRI